MKTYYIPTAIISFCVGSVVTSLIIAIAIL